MLEHFCRNHKWIQELREGPHGSLLEGFAKELRQMGYEKITAQHRIRAAGHLLHWMEREGIPISDVTESLLERFHKHLERCRCPGFGPIRSDLFTGDRLFLDYLRSTGSLTSSVEPNRDPPLLVAFRQWMKQVRGVCDRTLYHYGFSIRALLARLGEDPSRFDAQRLRQFVLETSRYSGRGAAKMCTKALHMFLRFLVSEGQCAANLEAAIPVLAHWRLSSLPRYLLPEDVERVVTSPDPSTPVGRRDRAILLLLARMGLRAGDIIKLRLGDIDWEEAKIRVCGKGCRLTYLPLTQEVGDAVVDYLKTGRPQTDTEVLFLRARAPFRGLGAHNTVSTIVAQAMRRAGVTCPSRGAAHVLRHSAATAMLRHGASLQEIATVLRHRSIETTQIYAKVDVTALQRIAQVWPEVQPC
ncbi:MAG: site-specific integrase [Syntrophorhabdales bacterium]|jgi:site-specific recombinase XerD